MRWISHREAQVLAFSTPDTQAISFRLPGHLSQDRVHLLARTSFGYRAAVTRDQESWVVTRHEYLDDLARARLAKQQRRLKQTRTQLVGKMQLRGGL